MCGQELSQFSPVPRFQALEVSDNARWEEEDDWIIRESKNRQIEPSGGVAPTSHVITRSITTAALPLPVVDSSRLCALDAIPERRTLFKDERMTEERARPGIIREPFGTEDVAADVQMWQNHLSFDP